MNKWFSIGILASLVIGMVLMGGCTSTGSTSATPVSSTDGNKAALSKMSETLHGMKIYTDGMTEGLHNNDMVKAGYYSVLLRNYIDENLPKARQLADGATTENVKASAREHVAYLEDLRAAANLFAQAADESKSGYFNGEIASLNTARTYLDKANAHLNQSVALLTPSP